MELKRTAQPTVILFICFTLFVLFSHAGCTSIPKGTPVPLAEKDRIRQAFMTKAIDDQNCFCCLDSEVAISWDSPVWSGRVAGYLQAMAPSFLKFVGVTPMGQPLLIFAMDGTSFTYVPVFEGLIYEGDINSRTFQKHVPKGVPTQYSFFDLLGRLMPLPMHVHSINQDKEKPGYWVTFSYEGDGARRHVLFDPEAKTFSSFLLENAKEEIVLEAHYEEYQEIDTCYLPAKVTLIFPGQHSTVGIDLHDWLSSVALSPADFKLTLPDAFRRIPAQ